MSSFDSKLVAVLSFVVGVLGTFLFSSGFSFSPDSSALSATAMDAINVAPEVAEPVVIEQVIEYTEKDNTTVVETYLLLQLNTKEDPVTGNIVPSSVSVVGGPFEANDKGMLVPTEDPYGLSGETLRFTQDYSWYGLRFMVGTGIRKTNLEQDEIVQIFSGEFNGGTLPDKYIEAGGRNSTDYWYGLGSGRNNIWKVILIDGKIKLVEQVYDQ